MLEGFFGGGVVLSWFLGVADQLVHWFNSDYGFYVPKWPVTLGCDGAGVVEDVGEDVQTFKKGDEVLARFTSGDDRRAAFQVRYCYSILFFRRVV